MQAVQSGPWEDIDGEGGTISAFGDVLFVRATERVHRGVDALLVALENPARQTFVADPPVHQRYREALMETVTLDVGDQPVEQALPAIEKQLRLPIRLDRGPLRGEGVDDRERVALPIKTAPLATLLKLLVGEKTLVPVPSRGAIFLTTEDAAADLDRFGKTAVYDVRDLCPDIDATQACIDALAEQVSGKWEDVDGEGATTYVARAGVVAIRATEAQHREVIDLLERYREAVATSKPRDRAAAIAGEPKTVYYRVPQVVGRQLMTLLPREVAAGSWQEGGQQDGDNAEDEATAREIGTIEVLQTVPEYRVVATGDSQQVVEEEHVVLVITHRADVHDEITRLTQRVQHGDAGTGGVFGGGGGDLGGGGFGGGGFGGGGGMGGGGGGFFSTPSRR